ISRVTRNQKRAPQLQRTGGSGCGSGVEEGSAMLNPPFPFPSRRAPPGPPRGAGAPRRLRPPALLRAAGWGAPRSRTWPRSWCVAPRPKDGRAARNAGRGSQPGSPPPARRSPGNRWRRRSGPPAQEAQHQVHRLRIEQPALVVPDLRPWIGKVDVERGGEARGEHRREEIEGLPAQGQPVAEPQPADPGDEQPMILTRHLDAEETAIRVLLAAAAQIAPLAEADLHLPVASVTATRCRDQLVERQRRRQAGQAAVARRRGDHHGMDHSSSPRPRAASSLTILRTSWERALGITSTVSPVRTTTSPSTPSTAIVPASENRRLPVESTASVSP